ncbi:MAG: ribonuclease R [Saprospiraceae bacterium]
MTKDKRKANKKLNSQALQLAILRYLTNHPKKKFTARQLMRLMEIENNKDSVEFALNQLCQAGSVLMKAEGEYALAVERLIAPEPAVKAPTNRQKRDGRAPKFIEGTVDMTRSGAAFILSEQTQSDVFVAARNLNTAMHGDRVKVLLFPPRGGGNRRQSEQRRPEGEVVEVLKRAREFFLGTIRKGRKYAIFMTESPLAPLDIFVALEDLNGARDGDKVVVRVLDWQEGKNRAPKGRVTQVLGEVGGNDFEMNKILIGQGFELTHSEEAIAEAARIPEQISPNEIALRRDFRDVLTCTIDPEDAKDFDDALSLRRLEGEGEEGMVEVGVHIADVTHYLKPDTALDREAYQRSTSVYLVDRVCPMLPEKLSNHLCSLVPNADRLTFSAVFTFDAAGRVQKRWFGKTIIHSDCRLTYEQAQQILDDRPGEDLAQRPDYPQLKEALHALNRLAKNMRKAREKNGAISFDTEEVRFILGEQGEPLGVYVKERKDAHLLIEDFMLLANKEVALYMDQRGKDTQEVPFVYRVHDLPDLEKVAEFARFASEMGYKMKVDTPKQIAASYNELLRSAQKDPRFKLLEPMAIRTMAKAVYSPDNIGHFGLAFTHYSHFTSPIRRYSDVLAHRILERNLDGGLWRMDKARLAEMCKHISNQEKKAADAERESIKYKQAEYLSKQIGNTFAGVVSGFVDRGFFVELTGSKAEGLVEFRNMYETFVVDEGGLRAHSRSLTLRMGDPVTVRVAGVSLSKRQIDLEWVEPD